LGAVIAEIMVRERPRIVKLASAEEGYLGLWLGSWLHLPFVVYAQVERSIGRSEIKMAQATSRASKGRSRIGEQSFYS